MKRCSNILLTIFAIGILICLFAGGLSLLGYIIAMVIGGENAVNLCTFIFKSYLPWVIRFTSIFSGIGLLGMYFSKIKALAIETEKEDDK